LLCSLIKNREEEEEEDEEEEEKRTPIQERTPKLNILGSGSSWAFLFLPVLDLGT